MLKVYYSLYDRLLKAETLEKAFQKVRKANGAPGIDGQTIADFALNLEENIASLLRELREKTYRPDPVRRKEISKPDGGVRLLGIPTVRDRVVQQALNSILVPIFDPHFHPSSYGYRKKRGAHDAIAKATAFMRTYHLRWVVDMDLSKCFDTLDHDLIIRAVRKRVADGTILTLIRMFLESGVMTGYGYERTEVGSPQGGVISPLLANIYLDDFDQFMRRRGHRIVRYADDILIFKASERGAENALRTAANYLENTLKLTVNRKKTHLTALWRGVKYLGVEIFTRYTRIKPENLRRFKAKVKAATRRNVPVSLVKVISDLNPVLRGFVNYFKVCDCKSELQRLMCWIRHRLRAIQLKHWKKPAKLHRRLRQLGYHGNFQKIKMQSWRNAACQLAHWAMPNVWLTEQGLFNLESVKVGTLPEITSDRIRQEPYTSSVRTVLREG